MARLCPVAGTVECAADLGVLPLAMHGNVSRVWQTIAIPFSLRPVSLFCLNMIIAKVYKILCKIVSAFVKYSCIIFNISYFG